MNGYEYALESDEMFESDESDEAYDESDELAERRRPGGRRPPRITPGRTGTGAGLFRPRPTNGAKYATQAQLEAGLARVGKQISANSESIKKVAAQANKINSELGAATNRLDKQVSELKKEVKKQAETSLLLALLQKQPELEIKTQPVVVPPPAGSQAGTLPTVGEAVGTVTVKKQSNLLPLILLSGSGGLGGGDSSNMLLLALAFGGSLG